MPDGVGQKEIKIMKLNSVIRAGLVSIGLLTIATNSAFAGGYFSLGNPGGMHAGLNYPLAQTPANQAWERNDAWAKYTAQSGQVQVPRVPTGTSGSTSQPTAMR
jgi:hypothetical protein